MSDGDTGPVSKLPEVWTLRDEEEEMDESMQMEGVETTDDPDFETGSHLICQAKLNDLLRDIDL